jgi:hypothetical protein
MHKNTFARLKETRREISAPGYGVIIREDTLVRVWRKFYITCTMCPPTPGSMAWTDCHPLGDRRQRRKKTLSFALHYNGKPTMVIKIKHQADFHESRPVPMDWIPRPTHKNLYFLRDGLTFWFTSSPAICSGLGYWINLNDRQVSVMGFKCPPNTKTASIATRFQYGLLQPW